MKTRVSVIVVLLSVFSFSMVSAQLVILSGPQHGSYYRFIEDINNVMGNDTVKPFVNRSTNGAATNYQQVSDPHTPFKVAMMQVDYLYYAQSVDKRDNKSFSETIKVIVPLATEEIHLVTTQKRGYNDLRDLDSAIVAIGNKNQGTYVTATFIKERSEVRWSSRNFHFDQALKDLKIEKIDAFFFVGTAPVDKLDLNPAVMVDQLALIPLVDFNGWAKYYDPVTISKEDYKWLEQDIPTFGVKTVLIVNEAKLTEEDRVEINKLVEGLKTNLPTLQEQGHPKWKEVDLSDWDPQDWPLYK